MRIRHPSLFAAFLLLIVGAADLQAQVMPELLGYWGGRVRSTTETLLDPADTRPNPATTRRTAGNNMPTRADEFWVLGFQDTGGQMEGWQRYTDWNRKNIIMTREAYGYPLLVTEIDGKDFKVEWAQGLLECEANLELSDDDTKVKGRFTCRRKGTSRTVIETVTRGRIDFERYQREGSGGGG